ncbi:heat-inducible transcriptional repressor HrcA [Ligilactobacillus pobuzihii]|uniref:Heat-inducible transcription repressor HrcA n=1 Tax=Ligilactobacillus pobuzihii TaxID=449659 RepID=A0A0R2LLY9_9LACO|nr:heat-inducible transcriptional repressor HrcA [Ligilactobacillus pobuzihii]KRK11349.1 heat-inducible transcription repressor [Ligilactobacillus pobuzihii E100301 = KCTC 13174]KRO02664.1 heat-inducible transcription repressor [Ligilactobacillus pobuzihii]GEN47384.1 heat-inducible transcription repressor HrcA [Ligilactobacillus pobuzihii]
MLTERQLLILETIIQDYANVGQPIGSKKLQEQLPVHVSSATIRNEMAVLERAGYIMKEHSSSGRVPSLSGYRYYIDNIVKPAQLDQKALGVIRNALANNFSKVDEIIAMSARLLSRLTDYTAISLKPGSKDVKLEGFRLVPLGSSQVMLIMVTSDGTVESQIYNVPVGIHGDQLEAVVRLINEEVVGLPIDEVSAKLQLNAPKLRKYLRGSISLLDVFDNVLGKAVHQQVFVDGKKNLLNYLTNDNIEQVKSVYSLVDHGSGLDELLETNRDFAVIIGDELSDNLLSDYSLISAKYHDGNNGEGLIAILGPTNMQYSKVLGLVDALRFELSQRLSNYYRDFNE